MNIHEYQAKALLRDYGAPVSDGRVVLKAEDAKPQQASLTARFGLSKPRSTQVAAAKALSKKLMQAKRAVSAWPSRLRKLLKKPRRCWAAPWSRTRPALQASK